MLVDCPPNALREMFSPPWIQIMTDQFHHTPVGVIIKLEDGRQSLSRRYFDKMAFHARKPVIDIK